MNLALFGIEWLNVVLFVPSLVVYLLPTGVAVLRGHPNRFPIFLLNLLLGWSFVAWVIALVWSFTAIRRPG
jgi:hypothetical protein